MVNSIDPDTASADSTTDPLKSALLATLLNGDGGVQNLLTSALSNAGLGAEEAAILDMMINSSIDPDDGANSDVIEGDYHETPVPNEVTEEEIYEELESLRHVNDTLAEALGACGICWGGNDDCAECEGHGIAGSASPDPRFFKRLIVPALKRVQLDKREYSRRTQERQWR